MAQINIRVDDNVKKMAEEACEEIGMSLSTAVNVYLKKLGREKRIPFEVSVDPFYSDADMERLRERISDYESGKSTLKGHDLIEEYDNVKAGKVQEPDIEFSDFREKEINKENGMTVETIRDAVLSIINDYPIKSVILFGSRAAGTNRDDSDVDLIIEFTEPVTLLTLSNLKFCLEEILGIDVDIVHGPIRKTDMIKISKETELYEA